MTKTAHIKKRRSLARALAGLILLATLVLGWAYRHWSSELSEDAMISADVVHISTPVPGRVEQFHVTENARVKKGDLLFTLDPTVYRLRVDQAKAEVAMAEAALDAKRRQISAEQANAQVAQGQVARAQSNLALARKSLERLLPLAKKGYVTAQQVDEARTLKNDAQVSLDQALQQQNAAQSLVGELDAAQAAVQVSRTALALAQRSLQDTEVRAPHNGLVVGLSVSAGERVAPDQSLFTLINTEQWYAIGFFQETEIKDIHAGSCSVVYPLADARVAIKGSVDSIGWGISSTDVIDLPRVLPIVQKSLNWVRVAQRFPVRVALDDPPAHLMRVGASAVVVIRHDSDC